MLSNNAIEILPEEIRSNLLRLQKLDLQGNPLRCDCHLAWIEEIPELVGEPKCAIPREYAGVAFRRMNKTTLACPADWWSECPNDCICYNWRNNDLVK